MTDSEGVFFQISRMHHGNMYPGYFSTHGVDIGLYSIRQNWILFQTEEAICFYRVAVVCRRTEFCGGAAIGC